MKGRFFQGSKKYHCGVPCDGYFRQFQSDYDEENEFSPAFIRNKPENVDYSGEVLEIKNSILNILSSLGDINHFIEQYNFTLIDDVLFRHGVNAVTTLSGLPVSKQSVLATLSGDETLSLLSGMLPGQMINIKVNALSVLNVILPVSAGWTLMNDSTMEFKSGEVGEINIWCTGAGYYSVKTMLLEFRV